MCHMGNLKRITYFLVGGLITPRCLKIWSNLVNLKYLGNRESLLKVFIHVLNELLKPIFDPILPQPDVTLETYLTETLTRQC